MPFGNTSHWLQPWQTYSDTFPASRMIRGVGINFNVAPNQADATAHLLADSGVERARVEVPWGYFSYSDPTQWRDSSPLTLLQALAKYHIRPLILLNANSGGPVPYTQATVTLTQPANAGDTTIHLSATDLPKVIVGKSGLTDSSGIMAHVLITSIRSDGTATVSLPMQARPAGQQTLYTLKYEPFVNPRLADGSSNPAFEPTMQGWLAYTENVANVATGLFGAGNFDFEVWNELGFGSAFLHQDWYYVPSAPPDLGVGDVTAAILARTVQDVRSKYPSTVGIGDGFSNQAPWASGATVPAGTTALDKHPYLDYALHYPAAGASGDLNALGQADSSFIPTETDYFPEYWLSGLKTENYIRDLSPTTTYIGSTPHGRAQGAQVWITETGLSPIAAGLPSSQYDTYHAKATLRAYSGFIGKGASQVQMFAAAGGPDWQLVNPSFLSAVDSGASYPGDAAGGAVMQAIQRFTNAFRGDSSFGAISALKLKSVADAADHVELQGDGTAQHSTIYHRDEVAFFPFQSSATHYVIPVYVMTRNLANAIGSETMSLTIDGLPSDASPIQAAATDPLDGSSVPVDVTSRSGSVATVRLALTDSPRLLTIDTQVATTTTGGTAGGGGATTTSGGTTNGSTSTSGGGATGDTSTTGTTATGTTTTGTTTPGTTTSGGTSKGRGKPKRKPSRAELRCRSRVRRHSHASRCARRHGRRGGRRKAGSRRARLSWPFSQR